MPHNTIKTLNFIQKLKNKLYQFKNLSPLLKTIELRNWLIVLAISLVLALFLTPEIYISSTQYKVGSIANRDLKADFDFLVEDRESLQIKRNEVVKEVQSVYDYDSEISSQLRMSILKAFSDITKSYTYLPYQNPSGAQAASSFEAKRKIKREFENLLSLTLTDEEFNILYKYAFSNLIADKTVELISAIYNLGLVTNSIFLKHDFDNGIIISNIRTREERIEKKLDKIIHINAADSLLYKQATKLLSRDKPDMKKLIISLSKKIIQPNLTFNRNETERKKQFVAQEIKPVFFQVEKNEMIVREGQKISKYDFDKIETYMKIKGEKTFSKASTLLGILFLTISLIIALYYASRDWFKSGNKSKDTIFLSITALLQFLIVKIGIFLSEAISKAFPFLQADACHYTIPFAVGPMLVGILINNNIALVFSIFSSLLVAFLFDAKIHMPIFFFLGSVVASYRIIQCKQRSEFFKIGILLGMVNSFAILFIALIEGNIVTYGTIIKLILGFTGGILSGIIIAGIIPLFENIFDYTTHIRLLELANLNQPIFQKMIMDAPGTYHHSIVVASLVEGAAEAIGANSLLAKVSAYYHDIGKTKKPYYFIENQRNGENKHNKLSPKMSSLIIISHVKDGCELGNKAKLGNLVNNVIKEHHGTSLVSYFYEKSRRDKDPSIRNLPETDFRYPGPKPQTKEAGLVLLGDVVEASARTLSNPTPSRIKNLVRDRIEKIFMDGQLDECDLTLRDLNKIADSFTRILLGIFHHRIDYPEQSIKDLQATGKKINNGYNHKKPSEKNIRKYSPSTSFPD